jgi:hypothetical protein
VDRTKTMSLLRRCALGTGDVVCSATIPDDGG